MSRRYSRVVELDAEKALVAGIKRLGGLCLKLKFIGIDGAPDRLCLLPFGRFYFVELKKEGGRLEASQEVLFPRIERLGFKVWILYGVGEVEEFLTMMESHSGI